MGSEDDEKRAESPLVKPIRKVGRALSSGYYGATYMPGAEGMSYSH
jgi:hypothetical protein